MMKKKFIPVFCIILLIASFAYAENIAEVAEEITLYVGQIKTFPTNVPRRIILGKPDIADVTVVTNSDITLVAKSVGATTLVFWDNFGEQSYQIKVVAEDVNEIKRRVDNLLDKLNLPQVYTQIAEEEGKVLLLGKVKTAQDREKISVALGPLKDKITDLIAVKEEEAAVNIDVLVLELTKDATNTLGFSWPSAINLIEKGSPGISDAGTKFEGIFRILNVQRGTTSGASPFTLKLDALIQEGKARVLSRPQLACQSGKEAELLVGGEKPVFTTTVAATTGAQGTSIEYKEFGIKLKIKPTVTEEKRIKLALNVEVSEVGTVEFIGLTTQRTAQAYPLTKRNASTELYLENGQTMAIGGLMKQKSEEDITKTPGLGDVPILGLFFRKKVSKTGGGTGERGNVELFITLTPTIIAKEIPQAEAKVAKVVLPEKIPLAIPPNLANYVRAVQAKIINATYYPRQAKDAGWEGTVKMSLNLSSNGYLKEVKILESSTHKILDDAALEVARKQAPYPPFPPQIDSQELWVDVPIVYKEN